MINQWVSGGGVAGRSNSSRVVKMKQYGAYLEMRKEIRGGGELYGMGHVKRRGSREGGKPR